MPVYHLHETVVDSDKFFVIAGPCVIESLELCLRIAESLAKTAERLKLPIIFKASFDKANRTSLQSYRGPGLEAGLEILQRVKTSLKLPLLSDIHQPEQAPVAAQVLDIIQIPAFLSRQTDLLTAAARTGKIVNIKKGQFLAPHDMAPAVEKVRAAGNPNVWLTERGSSFGYNNLVVDMRGFAVMAGLGCPVIFDATHSVQLPGGQGGVSGGERRFIVPLAAAATAAGVNGLFFETHPQPEKALCDGANSLPLAQMETLLRKLQRIYEAAHD
jgi:2-dehydro-3-deoxyphosphooctonate aldolase (KDO 8-P synthase)